MAYFLLVPNTTAIREEEALPASLKIYPNPATDRLTIEFPDYNPGEWLHIFDITGREVVQEQLISEKTEIHLSGLSQGVYIVNLPRLAYTTRFIKAGY